MSDWTRDRIDAAKARCDKATPGPWWWNEHTECIGCPAGWVANLQYTHERKSDEAFSDKEDDAAFIVETRADLPDALAEIEKLQEMLFYIVASLEPYDGRDGEWLHCVVCSAADGEPHDPDCGYMLGLAYFKRTRPELWQGDDSEGKTP